MEFDDYLIAGLVVSGSAIGAVYLFLHPSDTNFLTWSGLNGTGYGVYHWLRIKDSKNADA